MNLHVYSQSCYSKLWDSSIVRTKHDPHKQLFCCICLVIVLPVHPLGIDCQSFPMSWIVIGGHVLCLSWMHVIDCVNCWSLIVGRWSCFLSHFFLVQVRLFSGRHDVVGYRWRWRLITFTDLFTSPPTPKPPPHPLLLECHYYNPWVYLREHVVHGDVLPQQADTHDVTETLL